MEHIRTLIIVSTVFGIVLSVCREFKLFRSVKMIASFLVVLTVIAPLFKLVLNYEIDSAFSVSETEQEMNSVDEIYIESCKREIEKRLEDLLEEVFSELEFYVVTALDTSDINNVKITQVKVTAKGEGHDIESAAMIKKTVTQNTGCEHVILEFSGGDTN